MESFQKKKWNECLKELKKNTAAGIDDIQTQNLRKMPTGHITSIMNYWWEFQKIHLNAEPLKLNFNRN